MGIVPIAFCLSFILSGLLSKMTVSQGNIPQAITFASGFGKMSLLLFVAALIFALVRRGSRRKELANR